MEICLLFMAGIIIGIAATYSCCFLYKLPFWEKRRIKKYRKYNTGFLLPDGNFITSEDISEIEWDFTNIYADINEESMEDLLLKAGSLIFDKKSVTYKADIILTKEQCEYLNRHFKCFNEEQRNAYQSLVTVATLIGMIKDELQNMKTA